MIAVISDIESSRLHYAISFLLEDLPFRVYKKNDEIPLDAVKLYYGVPSIDSSVYIPQLPIEWWSDDFQDWSGYRALISKLPSFEGLDVFGFAFYLLARVDEYDENAFDEIGRFQSGACIQNKWNGIEIAYMEQWRQTLLEKLGRVEVRVPQRELTVDVDSPYAFRFKSFTQHLLGLIRDISFLKFDWVMGRLKVLTGAKDPYDTYSYINELADANNIDLRYFVLYAKRSKLDRGMSISNKAGWETIIKAIKSNIWGWHPGVAGHADERQHAEELIGLQQIGGRELNTVRFHYLKQTMPSSFQRMINWKIKSDFSMGFADAVGYRAGTSRAFQWFDLENNQVTKLTLVPFWGMDVVVRKKLEGDVIKAVKLVADAKAHAQSVRGDWRMVWHNESVNDWSEWKGWRKVLNEFVQL